MDMVLMRKYLRNSRHYLELYALGCLVEVPVTEDEFNYLTDDNVNQYLIPNLKKEGYRYYLGFQRAK